MENQYIPRVQITIYERNVVSKESTFYIEQERIKNVGGKYIGLGKTSMTKTTAHYIKKAGKDIKISENEFTDIIPENVIFFNDKFVVWYSPEKVRRLIISHDNIKTGEYTCPGTIFCLDTTSNTLKVFSSKEKPDTLNKKYYYSPYLNVYSDGDVCMGNVKIKEELPLQEKIKKFEKGFFESMFNTEHNVNTKKNTMLVYEMMSKCSEFDYNYLKQTDGTLKSILQ